MGAFIIFDIEFKEKKDREKFEKKYGFTGAEKKYILVDETAKCFGVAWTMLRDVFLNPVYFMGFMGYAEPKEILQECLKEGIKIKKLSCIPINDKESKWKKVK